MTMTCCGVLFAICTRFNVLLLSSIAIGGSLLTTFTCQFFTYKTLDGEVWKGLAAPFDELPEASVGLYSFSEVTTSDEEVVFGDDCQRFPDWKTVGQSDVFQVAQISGVLAPCIAFLAWMQILFEFICCRVYGGFFFMSTLFLLAAAAQAMTFLVFADEQFCLEPESVNECGLERGALYSFGAMILYIVLSCLVPNLPPSPGQRLQGWCILTGWKPNPDAASSHPRVISTPTQVDPEMPRSIETKETQQVQDSANHYQMPPEQAPFRSLENEAENMQHKSITVRPDGSVLVEISSPTSEDPNAVHQLEYPNVEAANAAGHTVETFREEVGDEEFIEEEVVLVEEEGGEHIIEEEQVIEEVVEEGGGADENDDSTPPTTNTVVTTSSTGGP